MTNLRVEPVWRQGEKSLPLSTTRLLILFNPVLYFFRAKLTGERINIHTQTFVEKKPPQPPHSATEANSRTLYQESDMDWKTHSLPSLGRVSCSEDTFDGSSDCTRESDYAIRKTIKRGHHQGGGGHGGNRRSQSMVVTDDEIDDPEEMREEGEETAEETHGSEELDHFSGYSQEFIDGRRQLPHHPHQHQHHPGQLQRQMSTPVQPSRWLQQQHQQQHQQEHQLSLIHI